MENNNNNNPMGLVLGIFLIGVFSLFFYVMSKDLNEIDTRVETIDGKTYDCAEAYASDNGMTSIRKPYYIQIPTKTVKVIKRLDNIK